MSILDIFRRSGSGTEKIEPMKADIEQKPVAFSEKEKAAIALALSLFYKEGDHDEESNVITINNADRRYSHWNLKIYNI